MNKKLYVTVCIFAIIILTSCQKKVIYATPEITGQVIDKQTNQPIENVVANIDYKTYDITDEKGHFLIPALTLKYRANSPSYQEMTSMRDVNFVFNKSGYEEKSYSSAGIGSLPLSFIEKTSINIGRIYLDPVPLGKEGKYRTHYSILNFCKPTESQREVDCIPIPDGKTYEEVSPNQPIK